MQGKRWAGMIALVLCAVAGGISYYLFARGIELAKSGTLDSDFCSAVFDASCDATLLSGYSRFLGLSVAAWGAIYYGVIAVLILLGFVLRDLLHRQALSAALALNIFGLVFSGYLSWLMLSGQVSRCPLCFVTHVLNVALFPMLLWFRGKGLKSIFEDIAAGFAKVFSPRARMTVEDTARTLAFALVSLIAVVGFQWFVLQSRPASGRTAALPDEIIANIMQAYMDEQVVEIPVAPGDPRLGSPDAPLQLVVFSDFECPSCKANERRLERLVASFGDRISIVYKNAPLSSDCNPGVLTNPHPHACNAAYAGIAAHLQGRFVPFHNALFHLPGAPTPQAIENTAISLGLDVARLKADMGSQQVRDRLKQDVDLAARLKIVLTPSMFLNGRQINSALAIHLGTLCNELLKNR